MSTSNEITLTRGLSKLKTLDKQIQNLIQESTFVSYSGELRPAPPAAKQSKARFQQIGDLIEFRRKLKSAIITSNAMTRITICGREMTVAEAIEEKQSIKHKKTLLSRLRSQYSDSLLQVETHNNRIRSNLEKETRYQSDDKKTDTTEDYQRGYMKLHQISLYDPISVAPQIDNLDQYIRDFECEVDHVLSESNAVTKISV
jgi:hypothetical protein